MSRTERTYLRALGYVETFSFLALLLVGMPLKYLAHTPEPSRLLGVIHGCLFIMYAVTLLTTGKSLGLSRKQVWIGLALSCIPLGPILFESRPFARLFARKLKDKDNR